MGHSNAFGSAHSAALVHNITPSSMMGTPGSQSAGAPASFVEKFYGHFGAPSVVATVSTVMMEALVTATTTQYEKILASMADLKTLSIVASTTTSSGNRDSATGRLTPNERTKSNLCINQFMSAIKGKWVLGRFCSTHGNRVGHGHSSKNRNNNTREGETGGQSPN